MKVSVWSWTDVGLSCGVPWKSFNSFGNDQITAMPTMLKHQEMLSIKNLPRCWGNGFPELY